MTDASTGTDSAAESALVDAGTLPGVPDGFQRLWTPHRMAYIQAGPEVLRAIDQLSTLFTQVRRDCEFNP